MLLDLSIKLTAKLANATKVSYMIVTVTLVPALIYNLTLILRQNSVFLVLELEMELIQLNYQVHVDAYLPSSGPQL